MENKYEEALYKLVKHINIPNSPPYTFDPNKDETRKYYIALQELVDKETPKKPLEIEEKDVVVGKVLIYKCPKCEHGLFYKFPNINRVAKDKSKCNYCEVCGQKINWREEKMTQKEIDDLRERVYSISNCMFPLDKFFNDIVKNKEPDFNKESAYNDLKLITDVIYELKEKEPVYTLEEVKKEWEEKGWKVSEDEYFNTITFIKDEKGIEFDIKDKKYFTFQKELEHNSFDIDCKLHELITKTLKAIEKEKLKDE